MILSVSRRTDIPAFYTEWFMNRIREQFVYVRNPFNTKLISNIPLTPNNIDCIVFWTKNSKPIHKYLDELDNLGYKDKYYFQFTITPYEKHIEPGLYKKDILDTFKELSDKIGKKRVILRYDPIFFNDKYIIDYHIKKFDSLCSKLKDHTEKVVISFLDGYNKIASNIKDLGITEILSGKEDNKIIKAKDKTDIADTLINEKDKEFVYPIAEKFAEIGEKNSLEIESCAEKIDLEEYGIKHGKCIDDRLIEEVTHKKFAETQKKDGQRNFCGCIKYIDIGEFNTCKHGCLYCYANINKNKVKEQSKKHNEKSPILIGNAKEMETTKRKEEDTKSIMISKEDYERIQYNKEIQKKNAGIKCGNIEEYR